MISSIDNFLSDHECLDIKQKVFINQHLWQKHLGTNNPLYLFPYGKYSVGINEYFSSVRIYNKILEENFVVYYNTIRIYLEYSYNIKFDFLPKHSYPGFHILHADNDLLDYNQINFHNDVFRTIPYKIYSAVIPIELPHVDTGLLYTINNTTNTFIYKKGMLAIWEGTLVHSIAPCKLNHGESRITMQMHFYMNDKQGYIFW